MPPTRLNLEPLFHAHASPPPLRFNPYTAQQQQLQGTSATGNYNNSYRSPMSSPPRTKRDGPPKLPSKKQQRSQSLTPSQSLRGGNGAAGADGAGAGCGAISDKYCSADGVCRGRPEQPHGAHLVRSATETRRLMMGAEKCNSADGVILAGKRAGYATPKLSE